MTDPLTPEEEAEVRARDASVPWTAALGTGEWTQEAAWQAVDDRRRLLATLDAARTASVAGLDDGRTAVEDGLWDKWTPGEKLAYGVGYRRGRSAPSIEQEPGGTLRATAKRLVEAMEANRDAINGGGHEGPHDRVLHHDPCTDLPGVAHVYSSTDDCAQCGGAQYGSDDDLHKATGDLRRVLGLPVRPWEERVALEADPQETERAEVCVHPGCGLPRHLHGAPPGEPPNPTRSTHRFKAPLGNPQ